MKNSNETIGNRTRDIPTCSPMPQPTSLLAKDVEFSDTIYPSLSPINYNRAELNLEIEGNPREYLPFGKYLF